MHYETRFVASVKLPPLLLSVRKQRFGGGCCCLSWQLASSPFLPASNCVCIISREAHGRLSIHYLRGFGIGFTGVPPELVRFGDINNRNLFLLSSGGPTFKIVCYEQYQVVGRKDSGGYWSFLVCSCMTPISVIKLTLLFHIPMYFSYENGGY